ncbi:MAG TPA: oxygen-independent coproporphyrinogen III oxidase [Thermoanaerobaculia bacterium]|nr:oxygen-independent coproporphyrinogen III oxidase [Thermoanaerobaculia bacterium]
MKHGKGAWPRDERAPLAPELSRAATAELLSRHDVPGPRYTSYPTAIEFHEGVGADEYAQRLAAASEASHQPLSVYVHLPFCAERCLFCGCNVIITPHRDRALPYLDLLRREMALVGERLRDRRRVVQLHLGGGTPTFYEPNDLSALVADLVARFPPVPGAELAVEVDPRVTRDDHVSALARFGFNRMSLGVQDLTPRVQEAIHRIQSLDDTARVVARARAEGFSGINVDLIYGLPYQTPETFETTVEAVIALGFDRAAVYSFAFVPWIRGQQKRLPEEALPDAALKLELFALARERFLAAGYEPIGMDHFALPGDELAVARREGRLRRNFQGYTVLPATDTVGLGISAIGDVAGGYFQNTKKLSVYAEALDVGRLPIERGVLRAADDEVRRHVIHGLLCNFQVDTREVEADHGIRFDQYFAADLELLRAYERERWVRVLPDAIEVLPPGQLFVRNLAMCFDRYLRDRPADPSRPTFSRTV